MRARSSLLGFVGPSSRAILAVLKLIAVALCLVEVGSQSQAANGAGLCVEPKVLRLDDADSRRQLLVSRDGVDVTHDCRYESSDPAIVTVTGEGYVVPSGPGQARVRVGDGREQVEV